MTAQISRLFGAAPVAKDRTALRNEALALRDKGLTSAEVGARMGYSAGFIRNMYRIDTARAASLAKEKTRATHRRYDAKMNAESRANLARLTPKLEPIDFAAARLAPSRYTPPLGRRLSFDELLAAAKAGTVELIEVAPLWRPPTFMPGQEARS